MQFRVDQRQGSGDPVFVEEQVVNPLFQHLTGHPDLCFRKDYACATFISSGPSLMNSSAGDTSEVSNDESTGKSPGSTQPILILISSTVHRFQVPEQTFIAHNRPESDHFFLTREIRSCLELRFRPLSTSPISSSSSSKPSNASEKSVISSISRTQALELAAEKQVVV